MGWRRYAPWLVFGVTVAVYVLGLRQAGFIWDDDMYVTSNATLRTVDGLRRIWLEPSALPQYYPLVHTTFWLEYRLWGLNAFGFHVVNALLHALGAVVLGRILVRLALPGAWIGAALFALHPVQVESVAWITERKNVLSGLFYFAAAWFLLRALHPERENGAADEAAPVGVRDYTIGTLLFLCALLSKTVTASLPAAVLLVLAWKRGRIWSRDVQWVAPLLWLGAAFGLVTAWIERHHVGAQGEAWDLSLIERTLIAGRAVWFYLSKLVWPAQLTFIYPRWTIDATAAWQYLFPVALLGCLGVLWWQRRRIGSGPLVASLFYVGTLFPALGFLNVFPMRYSFVADHFQYLAAAGPLALFGAGLALLCGKLDVAAGRLARAFAPALLAVLALLSFRQCRAYQGLEALWRDTLAKNPGAWMAHTNLGLLLVQSGRVAEGTEHYRESIRLEPSLVEPRLNLGELLQRENRSDEAVALLSETVAKFPAHAVAHFNLATALSKRGRFEEAIPHFEEALRLRPDFVEAAYNLGTAYLQLGRRKEAEASYREALRVRPDYGLAHNNLAAVLESEGRGAEAREHRIAGLRLRAWTLATHDDPRSRNGAEALRLAEQACRETDWSDARALDALAAAYAELGRFDEAVRYSEQAATASAGEAALAAEIEQRLAGYRAGRPHRDPTTVPRPGALPGR
jgi:tetratricopeptide (TPR) repeat protein